MIAIRDDQMKVFEAAKLEEFESRLLRHLAHAWPQRAQDLRQSSGLAAMRAAIVRARAYGFTTEYDIVRYVDLTVALGDRFDTDPKFPWAATILQDSLSSPRVKMDQLYEYARRLDNTA